MLPGSVRQGTCFIKMASLSSTEMLQVVEDALAESEMKEGSLEQDFLVRKYIERKFERYSNEYLQSYLSDRLLSEIEVVGDDVQLYTCPCCNYNTLDKKGEYCICEICYWEDDGGLDENHLSAVNGMSLKEAKQNFKNHGAMSENFLKHVDNDRMLKFKRLP